MKRKGRMRGLIYLWLLLLLAASLPISATDARPGEIRKVEIFPSNGQVRVEITLSTAAPGATVETAQNPDRLVVKFPGTTSDARQKRVAVQQYGVRMVRFGLHDLNPPETDLVVDLDEQHPYKMTIEGSKVILLIEPSLSEAAKLRNAPAAAASKPLMSSLGLGKSNQAAPARSTGAQGVLLTPPPSGPPIQFPQRNSADSSAAASSRPSSEAPSASRPNGAGLQEATVFPGGDSPGTGQVPAPAGTPQPSGLETESSAGAKVEPPSTQAQRVPEEAKASTKPSPDLSTSILQDTVTALPPASTQSASEKSPAAAPAQATPIAAAAEPSPAPAISETAAARPAPALGAVEPVPPPVTLPPGVAEAKPEPVGTEPALEAASPQTSAAETAPEPSAGESAPAAQASAEGSGMGRAPLILQREGENPDFRTAFRVKYVAQDTAYLDGGRAAGLFQGMKLVVRDLPNLGGVAAEGANSAAAGDVAELEVLSVAESSAVTEIHSPKRPVKVGDLAYLSSADQQALVEKDALSSTRKYPAVVSFTENDTLDEEARAETPKPPSPAVNRSRGRIGFDYIGVLDHGVSNMYTNDEGLVVQTDMTRIGGTYWNATGYWRGRFDHTSNAGPQTLQDTINRTYQLYTSYQNPNSSLVAGVGRMYLPWATSLDTIDGGYAGRKFTHGITSGIFLGSTPDPTSWSYAPNRQLGGAFINFEGGSYDDLHYTSTAGGGLDMLSWTPDRPFVFFENSISYKRIFSIYQASQIDSRASQTYPCPASLVSIPQCTGEILTGGTYTGGTYSQAGTNWGLGRSFTTFRFQPHPRIEFSVNHTYYRDLPFLDPSTLNDGAIAAGLFNKFLSQGVMGGVRVEVLKQIWVSTDLGMSSFSSEKKNSLNQMFGITFGHLPWVKAQLDARYNRFNSSFGTGSFESLSVTRNLGESLQLQVLAGQQNFASSLTSANRSRFINPMIQSNLGRHYFVQAGGTISRGNQMNYDQWLFTFGYRFDNRRGQKEK
jgi:hypothetical protein